MSPQGDKDASYTFQSKWDIDNLYLAFKIKDDVIINEYKEGRIKGFGGDCIEIFIDSLNLKKPYPGREFSQYYFGLNNRAGRMGEGRNEDIGTDAKYAWKRTKDGYNMEVAIPLKELSLKGVREGCRIAIDVCMDDADVGISPRPLGPEYYLAWCGTHGHTCIGAGELIFSK